MTRLGISDVDDLSRIPRGSLTHSPLPTAIAESAFLAFLVTESALYCVEAREGARERAPDRRVRAGVFPVLWLSLERLLSVEETEDVSLRGYAHTVYNRMTSICLFALWTVDGSDHTMFSPMSTHHWRGTRWWQRWRWRMGIIYQHQNLKLLGRWPSSSSSKSSVHAPVLSRETGSCLALGPRKRRCVVVRIYHLEHLSSKRATQGPTKT
jgi:hypothetical protein